MPSKPILLCIVNKLWEAQPVVECLRNFDLRPRRFPEELPPRTIDVPLRDGGTRTKGSLARLDGSYSVLEVWCIQELMDLTSGVSGSSTEEKARVLPALFANVEVGGVVAVGTAAWPHADENRSGSVVVGSSVFVHDSYANQPNQNSRWTDRRCEALVTSRSALFDVLDTAILSEIESRMIPAPLTSWSAKHGVQVDAGLVAVGNVNITDYTEYATRDPLAVRAALNAGLGTRLASLETTHGLIRMQSDAPFIFVSGIVNTVGCFAEMRKFDKAQNFVGAHNAGLLIAWLFGGLTSC